MSEFITNFHFIRPWYLLLLIVVVLFCWRFLKSTPNTSSWEKVCDRNLLDYLLVKGSSSLRKFVTYTVLTGLIFAIIAIAGPTWKKKEVPTLSTDNPVMILLNLSSDMAYADITPDRLSRAKFKIADLMNFIPSAQAGLIVYTDEPFLITPITHDLNLVKNLLPEINFNIMPVNGDRLDRAIDLAKAKMRDAGYRTGNIVIFAADGGQRFDLTIQTAETSEFNISSVNMSKESGEKLKIAAQKGKGIFTNLTADDGDVRKIAQKINDNIAGELKISENMKTAFEDFGYYLLFVPLLCCLYLFRKGILIIVMVLYSANAYAGFFTNANQDGLRFFNEGKFDKASSSFKNEEWKAASLYREGKFDEAYKIYSKFDDVTSLYNQGNALAKGGKIEDAIKKYEDVLEIEPEHEDAKFNLEYLKQQQNQQQQQNQNQNQDNNENQNQDQEQEQEQQQSQNQDEQQNPDEQNNDDNQKQQNDEQRNQQNQENNQNEDQQSQSEQNNEQQQQDQQNNQMQEQAAQAKKEKDDGQEYDEKIQAREQQYREIPEDVGGLLRAFIAKEYNKKRYE